MAAEEAACGEDHLEPSFPGMLQIIYQIYKQKAYWNGEVFPHRLSPLGVCHS